MSDSFLSQEEIEALLSRAEVEEPEPDTDSPDDNEISNPPEEVMSEAPQEGKNIAETRKVLFEGLKFQPISAKEQKISVLNHVNLDLDIVLGEKVMTVGELVNLKEGSIIVLDRLAGENAKLFVDDRFLALGEVVVLNDCFALRLNYQGEMKETKKLESAGEDKTDK